MAESPLTPEHAREYERLTRGGAAPGRATFELARKNVESGAAKGVAKGAAKGVAKAAAVDALGGGPEDPVADVAAGSTLAKNIAGGAKSAAGGAAKGAQSAVGSAYQRVSSPSAATSTVTRIVWAIALGLIALEVASEATGQFWNFNLKGPALQKQPYAPLYKGQSTNLNLSPSPANAIPAPLGGRSSGTQIVV